MDPQAPVSMAEILEDVLMRRALSSTRSFPTPPFCQDDVSLSSSLHGGEGPSGYGLSVSNVRFACP